MKHLIVIATLMLLRSAASAQDAPLFNPNTASEVEIAAVPRVTRELANSIIAGRPYASIKDLDARLKAVPAKLRTEIYGRLFVPINLNTATDAEILMIPGIGNRMLHEFKEYRPYKSMEQFRREIGKYVSKTEVARLERYVTLQ